MSRVVVRPGEGDDRRIVIAYHLPAEHLKSCPPDVATVTIFGQPFAQQYKTAGAGVVTPLLELLGELSGELHAKTWSRVVLAGWSEGCQGIRAHLWEGNHVRQKVSAIVALDGIHAPPGFGGPEYSEPWQWAAEQAKDERRPMTWTASSIVPPTYPSTRSVMEHILGSAPMGVTDTGWLRTIVTPGAGAAEHIKHAALAQTEIPRVLELADRGGSEDSGPGLASVILGGIAGGLLGMGAAHLAGKQEWSPGFVVLGLVAGASIVGGA
jgi:hypothetical protein